VRKLTCCIAMMFVAITAGSVSADTITYDFLAVLSQAQFSGPDTAGLIGATVDVKASVDANAQYIDSFGFPAVVMNNDATITISGASVAVNNGTFQLPLEAFYPSFAGLFTHPAGFFQQFNLPGGGLLTLQLNTFPTASGSGAAIGDTVNVLDFAPASSTLPVWDVDGNALYNLNDVSVTATTSVPEPSTLALAGLGVVGLAVNAYRRRRQSA